MRRLVLLLIVAAVLISAMISALTLRARRLDAARTNREIAFNIALNSYSSALHTGTSRKEVEAYLRAANTRFGEVNTAFGGRRESQSADLVEIGEEETSDWFCAKVEVYIAFEFLPMDGKRPARTYDLPGQLLRGEDTDVLQRIEIFRVRDCL